MKRLLIFIISVTLLLGACTDNLVEQDSNSQNQVAVLPDLTAGFADDGLTRTYVENGKYLRWHEADLITAFYGNALNRQYKFKGKTGDNSGTFSLVPSGELGTGNELGAIYAIYPYSESATITDEGVISLTLPAVQTYAENSFGRGANTMIAVTESIEDTFLPFKNACGYLKLLLYNVNGQKLRSIAITGNDSEKIAGAATATINFGGVPEFTMDNDATTTVTLDCGEDGIALGTTAETATELWVVLPETTFESGITIFATDTAGGTFEKSTSNVVAITRNDIQPMVALNAEFASTYPANNEIWYTNGSTTETDVPYMDSAFGVNILSNTYDAEKECWVIKFDGEVSSIGDAAFATCSSLTSVTIPNSVASIGSLAFYECTSMTAFYGKFASEDNRCLIADGVLKAFAPSGLTTYTISNSVTAIGESAFVECTSLKSITLPDSVTSIGEYAFSGCILLTRVDITDLSAWCKIRFDNSDANPCNNGARLYLNGIELINITIPSDIAKIKGCVFSGCTSLTSVTILDGVTSIEEYAFYGCPSLKEVYCKSTTPPTGGNHMFDDNAAGRKIYVPASDDDSVINAYKAKEYWSSYATSIEEYSF